jgi:hypothetical protein
VATKLNFRSSTFVLLGLCLAAAGCENRGTWGSKACPSADRVDVGQQAVLAVYYDKDGNQVGTAGESLPYTENNRMCPALEKEPGPGPCAPGACAVTIPGTGKTYCVKPCPP